MKQGDKFQRFQEKIKEGKKNHKRKNSHMEAFTNLSAGTKNTINGTNVTTLYDNQLLQNQPTQDSLQASISAATYDSELLNDTSNISDAQNNLSSVLTNMSGSATQMGQDLTNTIGLFQSKLLGQNVVGYDGNPYYPVSYTHLTLPTNREV